MARNSPCRAGCLSKLCFPRCLGLLCVLKTKPTLSHQFSSRIALLFRTAAVLVYEFVSAFEFYFISGLKSINPAHSLAHSLVCLFPLGRMRTETSAANNQPPVGKEPAALRPEPADVLPGGDPMFEGFLASISSEHMPGDCAARNRIILLAPSFDVPQGSPTKPFLRLACAPLMCCRRHNRCCLLLCTSMSLALPSAKSNWVAHSSHWLPSR